MTGLFWNLWPLSPGGSFVTRSSTKKDECWFKIRNATSKEKSVKYLSCSCLCFLSVYFNQQGIAYNTLQLLYTLAFVCFILGNSTSSARALSVNLLGVYCVFVFVLTLVFVKHKTRLWMSLCLCEVRSEFTVAALFAGVTGDSTPFSFVIKHIH